jgi:hypothetical protein
LQGHGSDELRLVLTVTEAAEQWSPGFAAVLDLSLDAFVARADGFLTGRVKKAPM